MSNRLSPDDFGKPVAKSLESVMENDLASYCKELMKETGCDVKYATQWCADRFDKKGRLNVSLYDTGIKYIDRDCQLGDKPQPFMLAENMVLEFHLVEAIEFVRMVREELLAAPPEDLIVEIACSNYVHKFMEQMVGREAFMVWRMCHMEVDSDTVIVHGMVVKTNNGLDDGPQYAKGRPLSVHASLLADMIGAGVFSYYGDAISR